MATRLLKWGHGVGLLIPAFAARQHGFKPGSFVRVIVLEKEIRIRPVSVPCVDDYIPFEENPVREDTGESYEKW